MNGVPLLVWERLAGGDILVGMLLGSIGIFVIDRKFLVAAGYALLTAFLSFFGIVHASAITWAASPDVAVGYVLVAVIFVFMHFYRKKENVIPAEG